MLSLIAKFQTLGFVVKNRLQEEKGATAVEYGIMVALIAVAIIVAVTLLGGQLTSLFGEIACKVNGGGVYTPGTGGAASTCVK